MLRWRYGLAIITTVFAFARTASAHGVVGDYVFLEPLITQDPTPANELDLLGRPGSEVAMLIPMRFHRRSEGTLDRRQPHA